MTFMIIWGHYHRSIKEEQSNWVVEEMDHRQSSSLNANIIKSMTSGIMMRIDWVNLANWRWKSFREQDRNFLIGTVWMTSNSKVMDHWLRFESKMRRSPWSRQLILVPRHRAESEINTLAAYLIFVIFFTRAKFLENKIYTKKRVNYDKIHRKLLIFCVITAKYTVNCQFFALNL